MVQKDENLKKKLESEYEKVLEREKQVRTKQIMNKNQLKLLKQRYLKQFFDLMKDAGVDPNDLSSVRKFLRDLEQQDPDLKKLFEMGFNYLIEERPTEKSPLERPTEIK